MWYAWGGVQAPGTRTRVGWVEDIVVIGVSSGSAGREKDGEGAVEVCRLCLKMRGIILVGTDSAVGV